MAEENRKWRLQEKVCVIVCSFFSFVVKLPTGLFPRTLTCFFGLARKSVCNQNATLFTYAGEVPLLRQPRSSHVPPGQTRQNRAETGEHRMTPACLLMTHPPCTDRMGTLTVSASAFSDMQHLNPKSFLGCCAFHFHSHPQDKAIRKVSTCSTYGPFHNLPLHPAWLCSTVRGLHIRPHPFKQFNTKTETFRGEVTPKE